MDVLAVNARFGTFFDEIKKQVQVGQYVRRVDGPTKAVNQTTNRQTDTASY